MRMRSVGRPPRPVWDASAVTGMDLAAGVSIPGLDLIERLGHGAQTEVFRCRHNGRHYAVKIGAASAVGNGRASVGFRREAALLASARDPALPEIYEVGEAGGRPYMVMEFVEGKTLGTVLQQGPLELDAILRLGADVAGGLAAAHRSGLVHLDVKPDNIIMRPDGRATLIDFGLAGHSGEEIGDTVVGTLHYSSPEQTGMLKRPVDWRADLYSLGVVLFEAITGTRPFTSDDPGEVIRMNAAVPAPALGDLLPAVSPVLAAIVAKLLAKDPDDRYQSSEGLIADLRAAADSDQAFPLDRHGRSRSRGSEPLPFVGRDAELDALREEWTRARSNHVCDVVVDGPMGAGKSRLVTEFLEIVAADEPIVLTTSCAAGNPVPFAGLRDAFAGYLTGLEHLDEGDRGVVAARMVEAAGPFAQVVGSLSPQLAGVLDVDPHGASDDGQFSVTFALFLIELARRSGGLILWIDDAHRVDDASDEVVRHLVGSDDRGPVLVVRTLQTGERDAGEGTDEPLAGLTEMDGPPATVHLPLGPIDDELLAGLVGARVRADVDREFALGLAARAGGNPLVLLEYLGAVIEAGAMWPSWGTWMVDHAGLETLALPDDIAELLFRRIDQVGPAERSVLTVAAAAGSPFDLNLMRQVVTGDAGVVDRAIARSVHASLVELRPGDRAAFVHERIAETLLTVLDPEAARTIHQRLAEVADAGDLDGDALFFVARHYRLGQVSATPARMVELGRRAGTAALDMHAAGEALDYLAAAYEVAEAHGVEVDAAFEQELATAYLRSGHSEVAGEHFERSIELTDDPWVRAAARAQLGRIDFLEGRYDQADTHVAVALRDVGRSVPRSKVLAVVVSVVLALVSTVMSRLKLTKGATDVGERRRLAILTSLHDTGGSSAYMRQEPLGMVAFALYGLGSDKRLGLSPEFLRAQSSLCTLAAILDRRRAVARAIPHLQAMARDLGNPSVMATVAMNATVATEFLGDTVRAAELARTTIIEFSRWMEPGELQMLNSVLAVNLGLRGHHAERLHQLELQARQSARTDDGRQETLDVLRGWSANAMGRSDPRGNGIMHFVERVDRFNDPSQRLHVLDSLTAWACELGPQNDLFDLLVDTRDGEDVRMLTASHYDRIFWTDKAYGRVAQWRGAVTSGADRSEVARRRSQARSAVRQARLAAFGIHQPLLHAKATMSRAMYARLAGHSRKAVRLMARVEQAAAELDAPALRLDVWCERARLLGDRGQAAEASAEIGLALHLTASQGWNLRNRVIREEFPHAAPYGGTGSSSTGSRSATRVERVASESTSTSLPARRLEALLQVSVAAASVIVPVDLARIALDEALTILGAERAFLFQADAEENLSLLVGRDGSSEDLHEAVGYSTTAVEQVRASRQALVVTGSEEGALIGSTSAVVHGLRSILVAPLQLEGRLTGVVYLDSRLAKGMFTSADVDILVAIATQVAVSLETARSAQLEMMVHAEREQRALVDTLRDVMADMTATLDPGEVLDRLLAGLARAVAYDAASVVVLLDDDGSYGRVLSAAGRTVVTEGDRGPVIGNLPSPSVLETLRAGQPVLDPDGTAEPPGGITGTTVGSWMAVPIQLSETTLAAVVVVSTAPFAYGETQLEIVRTVVAHGTVGYQNARLFTANRMLAVTDELSGLGNRRSFFDLATERLASARESGQSLSLLMIDIDKFKQVNDTYGHPTGDDVIREVAERLRSVARVGDVVGRYGGEEFALLLSAGPETALAIAERFRAAVADEPIATRTGALHVTVSVGMTHVTFDDRSLEVLLSRADGGLYEAKKGGRNLVVHR